MSSLSGHRVCLHQYNAAGDLSKCFPTAFMCGDTYTSEISSSVSGIDALYFFAFCSTAEATASWEAQRCEADCSAGLNESTEKELQ